MGGAEVCSKFLAEGVAKKGVEIHVITPNLDTDSYVESKESNLWIHRFKSPLRRRLLSEKSRSVSHSAQNTSQPIFQFLYNFYKTWSARNLAKAFDKIHQEEEFDLVHANNTEPNLALNYIKSNIPKTAHIRDHKTYQYQIKANACVAINQRKKDMAEEHGYTMPIKVIRDAIVESKISKMTKSEARISLNLPYENIVLFAGHFHRETDPTIIVKIAKELPEIDFVVCGKGPIPVVPESKNVHLMGEIKDIADYYKAADLTINNALVDWGPTLNVIESMANGTPVISYKIKGIEEDIQDKKTGFLTSEEKIKDDLNELFKDKKKLQIIGDIAKSSCSKFNPDKLLIQTIEFWKEVLK